ncbi:MAG: 4Fe-4S ferredoxin [Firmicutes bacterium HGW-Firmicutes-14]|nr:MAG: 4Fe-4S ferredoxin [Firmicutes bacterium HGW-Firmicutes-14]
MKENKVVGASMVVGGGIAGMQAALDMANGGYLVHLVTNQPSIGGKMAQLDKTFPTNECSMCLLGPKMTDVLNHQNIEIHTCTNIEKVTGEAGNFNVKVREAPRYVNINECTACGDCEQVCPVSVADKFNEDKSERKAIHRMFPQAVPNRYLIEKAGVSPCRNACPSGINVHGYVALAAQGKFREAWELIRQEIPFPVICGTVCHHPCESTCQRGKVDEPVAISRIKRFVGTYMLEHMDEVDLEVPEKREEKVAVVGSGPAGLACAYHLARRGYGVTVFEALPVLGGMMRVGIPEYRLPKTMVDAEIDLIRKQGVEIKTNSPIGKDMTVNMLFDQGYKAVFLGIGAHEPEKLNIPGEEKASVHHGVAFLRQVSLGEVNSIGRRAIVIGGGNTAIDAARTAIRLGAQEVTLMYRRSEAEMSALPEEVHEAREEGVNFMFNVSPVEILAEGSQAHALKCIRNRLGEPDASGRRRPVPIEGSEFQVELDDIIIAISQAPSESFFAEHDNSVARSGKNIKSDRETLETNIPGVFAGGDAVTGPATLIEAAAAGKEAAESIHRFLNGMDLRENRILESTLPEAIKDKEELAAIPRKPRAVPDKIGIDERKRTFQEVVLSYTAETAMQEAQRCLNCGICCECKQCVPACKKDAVIHDDMEKVEEINVGSVVLAPGFDVYDAKLRGEYGYGYYENVLTSMDFERLLSSTGPSQGHVIRPSDHQSPKKMAFIQCVGSRDCERGSEYCSSICCMYSTKEAIISREHDANIEPTIFYLDMRSYGKNFDKYVKSAVNTGVRYVRAMISSVKEDPETKNLIIKYMKDGKIITEEFEMVVLAVGVKPPKDALNLAGATGIRLNDYGFAWTDPLDPTRSSKEGIFVAGGFQGPRDIPETVMNASAAAASASMVMAPARGQLVRAKKYPPERSVSGETPRVGVFICRCGLNIASIVDVPGVVEYTKSLPNVVYTEENLYTCSQDTVNLIKQTIIEQNLNRVVVASCTIRTHQPLFREALRDAGLNQFLFEMANIRDQCSWVHRAYPEEATEKAKDLVRMAVAKVQTHEELHLHPVPVVPRAMIIGGGISGMTAALSLAAQGFESYLIEREDGLGGNLQHLYTTPGGRDLQTFLEETVKRVRENPLITVYTNSELEDLSGHQGHFTSTVSQGKSEGSPVRNTFRIEHGVVIVATGGTETRPDEKYGYGGNDRVMTLRELEAGLHRRTTDVKNIKQAVFIQCASAGDEEILQYCSRTCCTQSVKNAIRIKEENPDAQVYILYRDMRTYGFYEQYYKRAREMGVCFIEYQGPNRPEVETGPDGNVKLEVFDPDSGYTLSLKPDLVALATAIGPAQGADRLGTMLKVPRNEDGFFVETHAKLGPMDFPSAGLFLCGVCHSPKNVAESIYQAQGAVARACNILAQPHLMVGGVVAAVVKPERCAACLTCVRVCPYSVPKVNRDMVAEIDPVQCHGCGTCVGECPGKAIQLLHYKDDQMLAKIHGVV